MPHPHPSPRPPTRHEDVPTPTRPHQPARPAVPHPIKRPTQPPPPKRLSATPARPGSPLRPRVDRPRPTRPRRYGRRWHALLALVFAVPMTLTACNPGGEVVGKRAVCHAEGTQQEICDWQLKTRDQGTTSDWFSVIRAVYDRCQVGELYPKCGDKR